MKKILIITILFLISNFLVFSFVFAQSEPPTLNVGIPGTEFTKGTSVDSVDPEKFLVDIYTFLIGAVGIVAFVSLVVRGFIYMTSGVVDKKKDALEGIRYTFIGLFVALISWSLLNTISSVYVNVDFPQPEASSLDITANIPQSITDFREDDILYDGYWYYDYIKDETELEYGGMFLYRKGPFSSKAECEADASEFAANNSTPYIKITPKQCFCNGGNDLCSSQSKGLYVFKYAPLTYKMTVTAQGCKDDQDNRVASNPNIKIYKPCKQNYASGGWMYVYYDTSNIQTSEPASLPECVKKYKSLSEGSYVKVQSCSPK